MNYFLRNFLGYTIVFKGGSLSVDPGETIAVEDADVESGIFDPSIRRGEVEVYRAAAPITSSISISTGSGPTAVNAGQIDGLAEYIDSRVSALLVAGSNVNLNYSDVENSLTINSTSTSGVTRVGLTTTMETGLTILESPITTQGSMIINFANDILAIERLNGTGYAKRVALDTWQLVSLASADLTDLPETIDDRVAGLLRAGPNTSLTYNDTANTLTIDASAPKVIDMGAATEYYLAPIANNVIYRMDAYEDTLIVMSTVANPIPSPFFPVGYVPVDGLSILLNIRQTVLGGFPVDLSGVTFSTDFTSYTPSTTLMSVDTIGLIYNAPRDTWDVMAIVRGYV